MGCHSSRTFPAFLLSVFWHPLSVSAPSGCVLLEEKTSTFKKTKYVSVSCVFKGGDLLFCGLCYSPQQSLPFHLTFFQVFDFANVLQLLCLTFKEIPIETQKDRLKEAAKSMWVVRDRSSYHWW